MLTYAQWQQFMPFWSPSTVRRVIRRLERLGYIEAVNRNRNKIDQTKSYRICYEELQKQNIVLNNQHKKIKPTGHRKEQIALLAVQDDNHNSYDEQPTSDDGQTVNDQAIVYNDQTVAHDRQAMLHEFTLGDHVQKTSQTLVAQRILGKKGQELITNTTTAHSFDQMEQTMLLENIVLNKQYKIYHLHIQNNDDKQEEKKKIWSFYQQYHFYPNNDYIQKRISDWMEKTNAPLVLEALKTALEYGSTSWKYAESVLYDWQAKRYETVEDVEKAKRRKRRRFVPQKRTPIRR
ncbi:DnaD domain protein [Anoxybacteroides amylolyticum]|uniref:DnaD domain protein n=1 Tax=Anoxybacteroides amylolyticum TaxID=294699 RepID=A0A160F2M4_9BACL|nr:DnaD domain protein [Anoxybacillus amylolyticus]ANB60476.1 DnaD domain protein [Anoxybacillus amylolyticus]